MLTFMAMAVYVKNQIKSASTLKHKWLYLNLIHSSNTGTTLLYEYFDSVIKICGKILKGKYITEIK